jgi:hypothetical protein
MASLDFVAHQNNFQWKNIKTISLRRRRPKGRAYTLDEIVLRVAEGGLNTEAVVGLFYLYGSRREFERYLSDALGART